MNTFHFALRFFLFCDPLCVVKHIQSRFSFIWWWSIFNVIWFSINIAKMFFNYCYFIFHTHVLFLGFPHILSLIKALNRWIKCFEWSVVEIIPPPPFRCSILSKCCKLPEIQGGPWYMRIRRAQIVFIINSSEII